MTEDKSRVEEIRQRFDADVERFSNSETGQSATVDAPLAMSLIAEVAAAVTPKATSVLDVGCGAGNYTLRTRRSASSCKWTGISAKGTACWENCSTINRWCSSLPWLMDSSDFCL